ncbi:MAG: hypothetical protein FWH33_09495 [Oscillospiraceae bacterium]|nr:hypothetical protein [Oscillospiraceae bacterium]
MFLTIEQIHDKYDGEWVYLINLRENDSDVVIGGEVAAHSESRDRVIMEMLKHPEHGIYIFYAGKMPEGVSVLL